jgi:midasin
MFDPLQINLEKQLGLLLSNQDALKHITEAQRTILQNPPGGSAVLTVLSHLLRSPPLTALVAQLFRPLLVDLCARWLECYDDDGASFVALAFLLGWHPELYP